jgi:hypothetical protein
VGTRKGWPCHWVWTSFGLPTEYKLALHEEIFNLCYYSNGAFTHTQVYNLPIYLRRFYIKKLADTKKQEADHHESAIKGQKNGGPKIDRPGIRR